MSKRSAEVELKLINQQYKAEVKASKIDTEGLDRAVVDLDRDIKKIPADTAKAAAAMKLLGAEADGASKKLHDTGPNATNSLELIDKKLVETRAELARFADEFNRTGSSDALAGMFRSDSAVKDLEALKKNVTQTLEKAALDANPEMAKTLAAAAQGAAGTPGIGPILIGVLIGAAVAAAPFIGGVLGAGVLAGIGAAGIGAALAVQLKESPEVKAAGVALGHSLMGGLTDATSVLADPLIMAFGTLKTDLAGPLSALKGDFAAIAPHVDVLAHGIGMMIQQLMPGLGKALQNSGPILDELSRDLPVLGQAFSVFFDEISKGTKGEGEALHNLVEVLAGVIEGTGFAIRFLAGIYDFLAQKGAEALHVLDYLSNGLLGMIPPFAAITSYIDDIAHSMDDGNTASVKYGRSLDATSRYTSGLSTETSVLNTELDLAQQRFDKLFGIVQTSQQATLAYQKAITSLTDSIKKNGKDWDITKAAGQANREAVLQQEAAINALRDANIAAGKGVDYANQQYAAQQDALRATLKSYGLTDDKINDLIGDYAKIPGKADTVINTPGLGSASAALDSYVGNLNAVDGRHVDTFVTGTVTIVTHGDTSLIGGKGLKFNRWGGIHYADQGLVRFSNANMYPAGKQPTYGIAEPGTGGEAFVPRNGDYNRSTAILDQAARWYGGRFASGGGATTAAANVAPPVVNVYLGNELVTDHVKVVVNQHDQGTAAAVTGGVRY